MIEYTVGAAVILIAMFAWVVPVLPDLRLPRIERLDLRSPAKRRAARPFLYP